MHPTANVSPIDFCDGQTRIRASPIFGCLTAVSITPYNTICETLTQDVAAKEM